jgi:hypothetical protein
MVSFIVLCRLLDDNFFSRALNSKSGFFLGGGGTFLVRTISLGRVFVLKTTLAISFERKFLKLS